ncbi:hypothetical protein BABINDRAFT_40730 [Babjeviella inositovora NRRL Y-12698]|uniref:Trimethylguanosine synthase n=1 Tax=Babjeviella inositovora NRRL Y-12698 TaxID=984486 RepID=A0A1E3QJH5_9ASCO|nr:uncharacterized protein BABINDRAFT_40730 [Babjeviella inositovora NRRL Y-12698]ODQ77846.1 hypothetical protein BABINDRAFT_40730 [Babjeviella inositovora NRRL Y-12698]
MPIIPHDPTELLMHSHHTLPKNCKKYWDHRYLLFSKFDEGVYMNSELWYSVTPENIALFLAKLFYYCYPEAETIMDVFSGGGGNTIQFARYFPKVLALERNGTNIFCTQNNTRVYGVQEKVSFIHADWVEFAQQQEEIKRLSSTVDIIFSSPPWGGPGYVKNKTFDLDLLQPAPLKAILQTFLRITNHVGLFLPRNSNLDQLAEATRELLGEEARCRVVYVNLQGYCKGIVALWGPKFMTSEQETNGGAEELPY